MARARYVVVLAFVMFAIIGIARAAEAPSTNESDYEEDDTEFMIGTKGGDAPSPGTVVAAPIGGPVPPGAFDNANAQAEAPASAASSLHQVSAVAGAATAALAGFFYF